MKKERKNQCLLALVACMGSLLMLPMQSFNFSTPSSKAVAQQPAKASQQQLQNLAKSITVKVLSGQKGGSGILLKKEGSLYTVLSSKHVLDAGKPNLIQTADNKNHQAEIVKQVNFGNQDLVLLQFSANTNYTVASVGNSSALKEGDEVLAAGFPFDDSSSEARQFVTKSGRVSILLERNLQGGYQIGYTSDVEKGMSGGPLLNMQGQLVGVNGIIAQPLWGNPYVYEDGSQPNDTLKQRMRSSSWGVPTQVLAQLAPQFVPTEIAQQMPAKVKTYVAPTPLITTQVDRIAKEITVLIGWPGGNGSGVIVAKEGNTYYVLTADHVANGNRQLKVFTPDGKEYPIDIRKIKTWEDKTDLALLQFTSNETYQIATLANSSLDLEDQVIYVSGFPDSKQTSQQSKRQLNAGLLLAWDSGRNNTNDDRAFSNGRELVYTNITVKGMSGGPLLDIEGRLIGIHTSAESDKNPIDQKTNGEPKFDVGYSLGIPIRTFLTKIKQENIALSFKQKTSLARKLTDSQQDEIVQASLNLKQPESNSDETAWLNYGSKLWRLRRYEQAEQAFEKAIKKKPDFYDAWYAHGMALKLQAKYKQAIPSFKTAIKYIKYAPVPDRAWRQLGDTYWYLGEYEEARKAFVEAIEKRHDDFILYNWLAEALNYLGRYPEALKAGNDSIDNNPNIPESYIRRAKTREYLKDYSGAIADTNKALELQPDLPYGYQRRGYLRSFQKDYTRALTDINKAINLQPKYFGAYADRGTVYARMGNRQKFAEDFNQALRLKPDDASIYSTRANAFSLLGDTQKAIDDYTEAIRLAPEFAYQFYVERGIVRSNKKDYEGAIKDYTEALRFRPTYILAYLSRGNAYAKQGKKQESLQDFDKALSLQPEDSWTYVNRGYARFILKDSKGAIEDYDKAIKIAPELAYLFYQDRASARDEQEDYQGAVEDYSQAISLSLKADKKVLAQLYYLRGHVRYNQKSHEEAINDFNVAIQLDGDNVDAYGFRGLANQALNNKQKAIEDYQKAAQIFRSQNNMESYNGTLTLIRQVQQEVVKN